MATKFDFTATVAAPLEHVWECLGDPDFWVARLEIVGSPKDEVINIAVEDNCIDVELAQVVGDEHIPSAAKKLVGGDLVVERFVRYELAGVEYTGTSHGSAVGGLLKVAGTLAGSDFGGQTTEAAEGEATVTVPLIGGRLEKAVIDYLREAHERELAFVADYMAR